MWPRVGRVCSEGSPLLTANRKPTSLTAKQPEDSMRMCPADLPRAIITP